MYMCMHTSVQSFLATHRLSVDSKLSIDEFDLLCKVALVLFYLQPEHEPHQCPVLQLLQLLLLLHCWRLGGEESGGKGAEEGESRGKKGNEREGGMTAGRIMRDVHVHVYTIRKRVWILLQSWPRPFPSV